jgi:CRISPR-associated endonuclease Csn1
VQVDHILPWSRSGDDSFVNKTLCFAAANQNKRGDTPYEWFRNTKDESSWAKFKACVEDNKSMKGRKKRNYLLKDATVLEEKFRPRNLNDTKYATRVLLDLLARMYPENERFTGVPRKPEEARRKRRLFARPGPLTDKLRRAWGLQGLKKGQDGKRIADDRHHALDALIVAATSEGALQRLIQAFQDAEAHGLHRDFRAFAPPWPGFREEAEAMLGEVFVSRAERRRARGKAHDATIRSVEEGPNGALVYERKPIESINIDDLKRIKNPERNQEVIKSISAWIAAGKPKASPPKKRFGGQNKEGIEKAAALNATESHFRDWRWRCESAGPQLTVDRSDGGFAG